ncbi:MULTISPECIES: arsenate reductase family protein [unclassified Methanobrevibacter]|uniref:arsenate reductase family protein n=1 Tax=unclassified Methanobrevibacter TaxID=2638681 RepID=UPI0027356696|nr:MULTISPECIES: arsenate reductase family protein [unclassified Methanobrevibacter]
MVTKKHEIIKVLFVQYPKCSTCRKAKKWLDEHNIEYDSRHIVEDNPQSDEIEIWWKKSGLPLKRFFNTSGMKYRELKLKDSLPDMSEQEQFDLLATDGMLVKRPIIVGDDFVLVGFKVKEWEEKLL